MLAKPLYWRLCINITVSYRILNPAALGYFLMNFVSGKKELLFNIDVCGHQDIFDDFNSVWPRMSDCWLFGQLGGWLIFL